MSRIGKKGIVLPDKVKVNLEGQKISVEGPKGNLSRILPSLVCCTLDQTKQQIIIEKAQETKLSQALFGLSRTLVANMVKAQASQQEALRKLESLVVDSPF